MSCPSTRVSQSTDDAYQEALAYLWSRINYERTAAAYRTADFRLARMHRLMRLLGDPHLSLPAIHVTGTKGKGSVSILIAEALRRTGWRVGLYTSPHLERLEERYVLNAQVCEPQDIVEQVAWVRPAVDQMDRWAAAHGERGPTFFEITTAMAFGYFARKGCQIVVLEVGMGGRLDSTNVCRPILCTITSISLDHTRQLGNTLSAIAWEKAGIIKSAAPVVSSVRANEAQDVIRRKANDLHAPIFEIGVHFDARQTSYAACKETPGEPWHGQWFEYYEPAGTSQPLVPPFHLRLLGLHQCENAAAAYCALRRLVELGWPVSEQATRTAFEETQIPGRLEVVCWKTPVILDVAHNPASIAALVKTLQAFWSKRWTFVVAFSRDKDIPSMLGELLPAAERVIITRFTTNPRCASPDQVQAIAQRVSQQLNLRPTIDIQLDPALAWQMALAEADGQTGVCLTSSFFLVGEVRSALRDHFRQRTELGPIAAQRPDTPALGVQAPPVAWQAPAPCILPNSRHPVD